jgi:hypothetical protein
MHRLFVGGLLKRQKQFQFTEPGVGIPVLLQQQSRSIFAAKKEVAPCPGFVFKISVDISKI